MQKLFHSLALGALAGITTVSQAAIPVDGTGLPVETFAALPAATEWSTLSVGGGAGDAESVATLDTAMQSIAATGIATALADKSPAGTSGPAYRRSGDADPKLGTQPTGNKMTLLMATLQNTSGSTINSLNVSYTFGLASITPGEVIKGHRVYWSKTGLANSWTPAGTFQLTTGNTSTNLSFDLDSIVWDTSEPLYVVWADDNGSAGTDGDCTIDNVAFAIAPPAANILSFSFGTLGAATISGTNISIFVPDGTDVTALTPTFTTSYGATCDHDNGGPATYDFTSPQTYTVTSSDSNFVKPYTVTINFLPVVAFANASLTINSAATGAEILHGAALVEANRFYSSGSTPSVTLASGLTFGTSWSHTTPTGLSAGNQRTDNDAHTHVAALTDTTPGSAALAFRTLMRSYTWSSANNHLIDIPGLTPGHTYRLQLISGDAASAKVTVEGVLWGSSWTGNNKVLTATWIQSPGDTVANVMLTRNGPELETTAYALHDMSVLPSAPTGLTPTPLVGEVRLDWTKAAGAAQYNVKRSTTSGSGYAVIGTTTDPGTIYHDVTAVDGVTYYYVVSSTNLAGESADSAEVSSTPSVIQTDQTISFNLGLTVAKTTLSPAFVDLATASSGLTVTYSSDNEAVATVDEFGTVTIHGVPGVAHILADQAGNAAYNAAPQVSQELTVTAVTPVITWNNPRAVAVGTLLSGAQLNATASTSGTFTYTPDIGEELPLGSHTLTVHFTPANEIAYATPDDKTVTVTVGSPDGPTVINVNYGTASNASMNGVYSFDPTAYGSAGRTAPAVYGGNTWNDFGGDTGSANLLDSFGAGTGVGFSWGTGAVSSPYNDWNGLGGNRMLISGRFLNSTTYAAVFTLTGLNPGHRYDLYIASLHNTEVSSVDFQAVGDATTVLHTQHVNATGWVAGQNHVYFTELLPAADGTLVVNAQRPGGGYLNGFQLVDLGATGSADYLAWAALFEGFTDTAATSDPDGDGVTNEEEYAFGLNPTLGSSVSPIADTSGLSGGQFSYTRRATTGLTYTVRYSVDLESWTPDTVNEVLGTPGADGVQTVDVTLSAAATDAADAAGGRLFLRVEAE